MDEAIFILPVDDVPLQRWLPSAPTNSIKVEWMEEDLLAQEATVSSVSGTDTPWTVTVGTDEGDLFRAGDILWRKDDDPGRQYLVTAVSGDDLTVAEHGSTDGATSGHDPAASDVLVIVGQFLTEGGDPLEARTQERVAKYNITEIDQEKVEATRTQRKRAMFAQVDPYTHEVSKKFRELAIRFERKLLVGYRNDPASSTGKRQMGGIFFYSSSFNSQSGTAAQVKSKLSALIRDCWTDGSNDANTLVVSPAVQAAITANFDAALRRSARSEVVVGYVTQRVLTDFGEVELVVDRYMPKTKALLLSRSYLQKKVFDGYFHELLAKTGDSDKGHIVGEYSLEVKEPDAHGVLTVTDAT
jgi:hypothetical protein